MAEALIASLSLSSLSDHRLFFFLLLLFKGIWVSLFKRQPGLPWPPPAALAAVRQITVWVKL